MLSPGKIRTQYSFPVLPLGTVAATSTQLQLTAVSIQSPYVGLRRSECPQVYDMQHTLGKPA